MSRLLISAAHKSSGKTTITLGLCAALAGRGLAVQPFKKGPWLGQASGRPCHNLDFYCMSHAEILSTVGQYSADAEISLIEGNKGLYDGLDLDGSNSNAALAKLTQSPVILVLDARGMTRGIAPLILGYQAFDPDIRIAGVILNQLGGSRHEAKLRSVIEHYTATRSWRSSSVTLASSRATRKMPQPAASGRSATSSAARSISTDCWRWRTARHCRTSRYHLSRQPPPGASGSPSRRIRPSVFTTRTT
jgi:dethiobiotin synthetase